MRSKTLAFLAIIFVGLSFFPDAAIGREQPKPLIYLGTYKVKPAKVDEFESVMKDFVNEMKKYDMPYSFRMYSTEHFIYYSVNEFENYSMLDKFNADWGEVEKKIGAETMDRYHTIEFGAIDSFKGTLLKYRPDHSYFPSNPRLSSDEVNYVHLRLVYIDPLKRREWSLLQKKRVELYKNSNIRTSLLSFTGDIGYEMPVWIHAKSYRSRADYISESDETKAAQGAAMNVLMKQSLPLIKKVEERHCFYRRDLSYTPRAEK